ncbi:MAG: hypothetical protein AAF502_25780 [Bacteroidota bacterium]
MENDLAYIVNPNHTHDPPNILAIRFRAKLISESKNTTNSRVSLSAIYHSVHNQFTANADPNAVLDFPSFPTMQASMSRARLSCIPKAPNTFAEISIAHLEDKFLYDNDSQFFVADSGIYFTQNQPHISKRLIVFAAPDQDLARLGHVTKIDADGTFWTTPHLFYQLFTVHANVYGQTFPFFYCLLPDKTEDSYEKAFAIISNVCRVKNISLDSWSTISSDFEIAIHKGAKNVFPNINIRGCFFHYGQAIYNKVKSMGWAAVYKNDYSFYVSIRRLIALGMVPAPQKYRYFVEIYNDSTDPRYHKFCDDYFVRTWLIRYSQNIWDWYNVQKRTNNDVEGWHNRLNKFFSTPHLSLYRFVATLLEEAKRSSKDLQLRLAGANLPRRNPVYQGINQQFVNLFGEFHVRLPLDYVDGFIHALADPRNFD